MINYVLLTIVLRDPFDVVVAQTRIATTKHIAPGRPSCVDTTRS